MTWLLALWPASGLVFAYLMHRKRKVLWDSWGIAAVLGPIMGLAWAYYDS